MLLEVCSWFNVLFGTGMTLPFAYSIPHSIQQNPIIFRPHPTAIHVSSGSWPQSPNRPGQRS
ncbi:hypothetical protein BN874_540025 [Candidatus Contendobacter odensis Run_B_J11]|uniref:Uncharacterized protein n=1 Tax=Candidatus Contendobacter odensis Run_B_J11 TaxID=1400861 RepID=A0A7U7GE68_9GAMM|nr:hypothetical protein BN874_540025 [Candidatus Contendobacter odensis Run_B_J11]